jgi:hypothetical protein
MKIKEGKPKNIKYFSLRDKRKILFSLNCPSDKSIIKISMSMEQG